MVKVHLDRREFDQTLRLYARYSKRDPATICNTKGFFIARRAVLETKKASKAKIARDLREGIKTGRVNFSAGKNAVWGGTLLSQINSGVIMERGAPLAALIINKRRSDKGQPGLYGDAMKRAIASLIAVRKRSVAFLKSGWLPAIKTLEPLAQKRGAPRSPGRDVQIVGKPKGYAIPAKEGFVAVSEIVNQAIAKHDRKDALQKYGGPALEKAFRFEMASMRQYIERKMRETAKRAGIRTN